MSHEQFRILRGSAPLALVLCALGLLAAGPAKDAAPKAAASAAAGTSNPGSNKTAAARKYTTETVRGKVVWLEDALQRVYGVKTEPAAAHQSVVLGTAEGRLLPIIPDTRGQAFAVDQRLRDIDLELLVRRYAGVPMIQVIRVERRTADGLYEIDYWCDVCAIPMFILKPCECCQGPTRLRERPVERDRDEGPR